MVQVNKLLIQEIVHGIIIIQICGQMQKLRMEVILYGFQDLHIESDIIQIVIVQN